VWSVQARRRAVVLGAGALALSSVSVASAAGHGPKTGQPRTTTTTTSGSTFAVGQMQGQTVGAAGCGTNIAGEPSLHVSKAGLVVLGSEDGVGGGSQLWRGTQRGGTGASACSLTYSGQPNAVSGVGASGGDIDTAIAPVKDPVTGKYRVYVASLNLASINVATSTDDAKTFTQVPVQAGVPVDDREWIAAYGASTSLLTYHDILSNNIDVLRSDTGGGPYVQTATAIPSTDYKASNNELGNIAIDHNIKTAGGGFYAYQSFVAPSKDPGPTGLVSSAPYNEAFAAVSSDGGHTFADRPIPCSTTSGGSLNHQFPNVSVAPNGSLVETWSNDSKVFAARSADHGRTWTCTGSLSNGLKQAVEPWVVASATGTDLVYYGTADSPSANQLWSVYLVQDTGSGFGAPKQVTTVHRGTICEGGVNCTTGRQLFDDFAVDTDPSGYAHIAYSHDAPGLGGSGTYTGNAVQTSGTTIGAPN
jgi:hypothetical protein